MAMALAKTKSYFKWGKNGFALGLASWLVIWSVFLAINPVDRSDWLLENLLVFALVGALVVTHRWFPLSNFSLLLITIFLSLHLIGAHYTYAKVPLGFMWQEAFGLSRNHFDRVIHFAFGLLMTYPMYEIFSRVIRAKKFWLWFITLNVSHSLSGLFELLESWVARVVSPELGAAYLGTQGDVWDAQKDMTFALVGAILAMIVTIWWKLDKLPLARYKN